MHAPLRALRAVYKPHMFAPHTRPLGLRQIAQIRPVSLPNPSQRNVTMAATASPILTVVKGVPEEKKLGDCPFCHRVLLTLETKKLPYTLEYIDFDHKPQWLLDEANGKVPVIKEMPDSKWLPDSDAIVAFLEEKYPNPSMQSDVPSDVGCKLMPSFREFLMSSPSDPEDGAKLSALQEQLGSINSYLQQHGGPFFGGKQLNSTDASLAPKLYHTKVALSHFRGWSIPADLSAIYSYFDALAKLPEWQHTDYGSDMIIRGWENHGAKVVT